MFRSWWLALLILGITVSFAFTEDDHLKPGHSEDEHDEDEHDEEMADHADEQNPADEEETEDEEKDDDKMEDDNDDDEEDESQGDDGGEDENDQSHLEHDAFLGKLALHSGNHLFAMTPLCKIHLKSGSINIIQPGLFGTN